MKEKSMVKRQNTWLIFGLIGAGIYMGLFLFYVNVYFPALKNFQDRHQEVPSWYYKIPDFTGHAMLSARLESDRALGPFFCNSEKSKCEWTDSGSGADQFVVFLQVSFMTGIFFSVGAGIGVWIQVRKRSLRDKRK